jgi:hypothetical protein
MSEYQYYEFQAVDRSLDAVAQTQLRAISSRARIAATGFVNSYDWGDLKADPLHLLEHYFDLFLYVANWGARRFAMRLPKRLVDACALQRLDLDDELVTIRTAGEHVIVDIARHELELDEFDDGEDWLPALAPLRANVLDGDLRLFGLLWLMQVQNEEAPDEAAAPLSCVGPLDGALETLAEFLCIDRDLVTAAGRGTASEASEPAAEEIDSFIREMPESEKIALLRSVYAGDNPHLRAELRRRFRRTRLADDRRERARRTAGELRADARRIAEERAQMEAAERRRREEERARARADYLGVLAKRQEGAWREVDELISERNGASYDKAAALLVDLGDVAARSGGQPGFARRLADLGGRHARKGQSIRRLRAAGLLRSEPV